MADQVYNLTQTGAEVQAIINDANNAKGAGATTSLSTDYIMLKDTSGQYHKIQKDSFTEAVRNTLASLLVNNDKGTTISQIAAIASGDFGSVTPANLASVLGANTKTINSITEAAGTNGVYRYLASNHETPFANNATCCLRSSTIGSNYTAIEVWHFSNPQKKKIGYMTDGSVSDWYDDYNTSILTDSSLLSPLASALGGTVTIPTVTSSGVDLNNYTTPGLYFMNNAEYITNKPSGLTSAFHFEVSSPVGERLIQTAINAADATTYRRVRTSGGSWIAWKEL